MPSISDTATHTPKDMAEKVREMLWGAPTTSLADLFAADGVMEFPFAEAGMPTRLSGREAIRAFYARAGETRELFEIEGVDMAIHETADPEVVVIELEHHGTSHAMGGPYRFVAVGVIRVRDGEIVSYRDYMNPVGMARLLGRTEQLAATLAG